MHIYIIIGTEEFLANIISQTDKRLF